jgi:class 3 adenylate cyclase/tetratricopeptide (TPR) repeat protein
MSATQASSRESFITRAEASLAAGDPLPAYDVTRAALDHWPDDTRLRQLHALALLRSGALSLARPILERLEAEQRDDEETLGLLARVYKDAALQSEDAAARRELLERAADRYARAWFLHQSTWTGINAATCNVLLGRRADARLLASDVSNRARVLLRDGTGDAYWTLATIAEAALIAGDECEAANRYREAAALAHRSRRFGDLASTRRNLSLLLGAEAVAGIPVEEVLPRPRVVVFSGHRPDEADRSDERFPVRVEDAVAMEIRDAIQRDRPAIGFCSAAAGADQLFIAGMLDAGAEVQVLLPFGEKAFVEMSVRPFGERWVERWSVLRSRVASVRVAAEEPLSPPALSYEYANRLLLGLSRIRASLLDANVSGLALLDAGSASAIGGAAGAAAMWNAAGLQTRIIDLARIRGGPHTAAAAAGMAVSSTASHLDAALAAFVFCDAVGFSRLSDTQIPAFVRDFLGPIGALAHRADPPPLLRNTWGDGLFFVFAAPADAAAFALELSELVARRAGSTGVLPADLTLRIGLHAGPVYRCDDPITGATNFFGAHVSRAARIEPVTPPGHVFASESLTALIAASGNQTVECDYVGRIPLAKGYGSFPMYLLRRIRRG